MAWVRSQRAEDFVQTAVAMPERWVATVMRRLRLQLSVFGLLVLVVFKVQVSVHLVTRTDGWLLLLVVVVLGVGMGTSVETRLGPEGGA